MKAIYTMWRWGLPVMLATVIGTALGQVNNCIPTVTNCSPWSCTVGSVNYSGTLSPTNFTTICRGESVSVTVTGTTFNDGNKSQTCSDDCGNQWGTSVPITYTPLYVWTPALPSIFTNTGTYYFTNEVEGISQDPDCTQNTAFKFVGVLTVIVTNSPPVIITQPTNQTVAVGDTAAFSVLATGCPTVTYQWYFNTNTLLAGQTNSILILSDVQTTNAGYYSVVVSDYSGSITSSQALLTVYFASCASVPPGIISWWPGDGNADDIIGTNNGILDNGVTFTNGVVGQAFHFNGTNQDVRIPYSTSLEPTNVTVECWVKLDSLTSAVASSPGLQYIVFKQNSRSGNFEGYDLEKNRISGQDVFRFEVTSAGGTQVPATATTIPQPGVWYHLAGTYDGTTVKIYVNGVLQGTATAGFPLNYGTEPVYFGTTGQSFDGRLEGALDEVSIYGQALSSNQIDSIYLAGAAGKCTSCYPIPASIVAWWPGQSNYDDVIGGNDDIVTNGAVGFAPAEVGAGFNFTGGSSNRLIVPDAPALDIGSNIDFTIETWIRAYSNTMPQGVLTIADKRYAPNNFQCQGYEFSLFNGQLNLRISANSSGNGTSWSGGPYLLDGQLHHVAVTVMRDSTNGGNFYVDGTKILQFNPTSVEGDLTTTQPLRIGNHPDLTDSAFFKGQIDELSIYKRALSSNEIAGIFLAGPEGKCSSSCDPPPSGIVSWWPGEGNANDIIGPNNGILEGSISFGSGEVGEAFKYTTTNDTVRVPASSSLNVGTGGGFTVEVWINPSDVSVNHCIFEWNNGTNFGTHFYITGSPALGTMYANVVDTGGSWHQMNSSVSPVITNAYQHVALTYDKASGTATLYYNGSMVGQQNLGSYSPQTSYDLYLGRRPPGIDSTWTFSGLIDEPTLYNRALSSNEIAAIYGAGPVGKCRETSDLYAIGPTNITTCPGESAPFSVEAGGCSPITYQWIFGTNTLRGQTNSSLLLTNVYPNDEGTYSVIVSAPCGSITNSATLTVLDSLEVAGPDDLSVCSNSTAVFGVTAFGTGPFSYQWSFGTNDLAGRTNSTLTISNVSPANVGMYSILVSGACGTVIQSALLSTLSIATPPAIQTITYGQSATFSVVAAGDASPTYQWQVNGANIPGATASFYTVVNPAVSQSGNHYDVIVSSPYCSLTSSSAQLVVNPAPLLVSADNKSRAYGTTNPPLTWTGFGFVNGDNSGVLTGNASLTCTAATNSPVGNYPISISQGTLYGANYLLSFSNSTMTVAQAVLDITADNKSRQYDTTNPPLTWTPTGFLSGDTSSVLSGQPILSCAATTNSPVGNYPIVMTVGTLACTNYSFVFSNGVLTVTQAPLTVTASNQTKAAGSPNPTLTGILTGILNNDNITAAYSTSATTTSPDGIYPIVPTLIDPTGKLPNYNVTIIDGVLTITNTPPVIPPSGQPQSTNLIQGGTLNLTVSAAGSPPLAYQWKLNNANVSGATASKYTKYVVRGADAGNYLVVVTNSLGSATSSVAIVNVSVPILITQQPTNESVMQGSNATFTVSASGATPLSYQWWFNGTNLLAGQTNTWLTITNAQTTNEGDYNVVITNVLGSAVSLGATLTVNVPVGATPLDNLAVCPGTPATFYTLASGTQPLTYAWYFNSSPLSGQTNDSLTINNAGSWNAGMYAVVVTGPFGSPVTNSATLTINTPVSATTAPGIRTNTVGTTATFTTTPSGTGPYQYAWYQNGVPLGQFGSTLTLNSVQSSNAGIYNVVVSGACNTVTNSATLIILAPPAIATQPLSVTTNAGANVSFSVTVSTNSTAPLSYQWYFNTNSPLSGATNALLSLLNVQAANAGYYSVVITNFEGSVTSSFAKLTITAQAPVITLQPANQTAVLGNSVNFIVTASGTQPLRYQWRFDGTNITAQTNTTLNLPNVQTTNTGNYTVVITNSAGSVTSSVAALTVFVAPSVSIVSPLDGSRIANPTNLTITAFAQGFDTNISQVKFFLADGAELGQTTVGTNGYYSFVWTNVQSGTYELIAVATDSNNVSATSSAVTITVDNIAFLEGVNLDGPAVTIEGNLWLAYTNALAHGLSQTNGVTNYVAVSNLIPTTDTGTSNMLQDMLTAYRLPSPSQQTNVQGGGTLGFGDCYVRITLTGFPNGYMITNENEAYRGWCVNINNDSASGTTYPSTVYYPYGYPDPRYHGIPVNEVNYILNHKQGTNINDIQNAIWTCMGQGTTNINQKNSRYTPTTNYMTMTNYACLYGTNFVPGCGQVGMCLLDPTNEQPLGCEIGSTNCGSNSELSVSFTITQTNFNGNLTNGYYYVYGWLVLDESNGLSQNIAVQGQTVAAGIGTNLSYGDWVKLGPYGANVTNGSLSITVTSPSEGNPILMGMAIYSCQDSNTPATVSITPANPTECVGSNLTLSAVTTGIAPFSYAWSLNGSVISGQTASSLPLNDISQTNAGTYTVIATAANGAVATNSTSLTVSTNLTATPLLNSTNCPGTTATFSTIASGTGPYQYSWYQNGSLLTNQTATLTISNVQAGNAGAYSVIVSSSGCGGPVTNSAILLVNVAVSATPLISVTNCPGTPVTFTTTASGTGPFDYIWNKNGVVMTNQDNNSLSLTNVGSLDSGTYSVEVIGACGAPVTNSAILVLNANVSATPLVSITNLVGTTASFGTTASGAGPYIYAWYQNGIVISNQAGNTLTLTNVTPSEEGIYTVVVMGGCGAPVTNSATLTVWQLPTVVITSPLTNTVLTLSNVTTITATALSSDSDVTNVQFFLNGTNNIGSGVPGANNTWDVAWTNSPIGTNFLTAVATDGNGLNTTSAPVNVIVIAGLSVSIVPTTPACTGLPFSLYAVASGSTNSLTYWWLEGTNALNQTNSVLDFPIVTASDATNFTVIVSNLNGYASATNYLTVLPGVTAVGPANVTIFSSGTVGFSTIAYGVPPFNYQWYSNSVLLSGQISTNLTVTNATTSAVYSVVITSGSCGSLTNSATLTVVPPPTIYIVQPPNNARETAFASLQLMSVVEDLAAVTNVVYSTNNVDFATNSVSPYLINLSSLPPGTYVFQATAYDNEGRMVSSPLLTNVVIKSTPFVQIFEPLSNDTFVVGQNIPIGAIATDTGGAITNVQFQVAGMISNVPATSVVSGDQYYSMWTNAQETFLSTNIYVIAMDNQGSRATSIVSIVVEQACVMPLVTNLTLSVTQILSGETISGTVFLNNPAPVGGAAVNLSSSSAFVTVPPVVLVPESATQATFDIDTTPVNVTNTAVITAAYHNENNPPTNTVMITPGPESSNGGGDTNGDPVLISGNDCCDVNQNNTQGKIDTFGFPSGILVNSFIPETLDNGRGIAVSGNEMYYTEDGSSPQGIIPVAPYGYQGSGGSDITTLPSPNPNVGIAELVFHDGALYSMVGYNSANSSPQVYKLDPVTGAVLAGPITISGAYNIYNQPVPTPNADGFTVLPDGNFLVNDDDGGNYAMPSVYREYSGVTGQWITNGLTIQLSNFGLDGGTGATADPDGQSLYIIANVGMSTPQVIIQTDLKGNLLAEQQISDNDIEEISVVRARPDESDGAVIVVRDDLVRTNTPFNVANPQLGSAAPLPADFDTIAISGFVTGARLSRSGITSAGTGGTFDAELGAAATNGQSVSYGPFITNANLSGVSPYCFEWALPDELLPVIGNQLNSQCSLLLTDSVSSVCGTAYSLTDTPEYAWPLRKNILTLAVSTSHLIPQGRCRSFVLTGINGPVNGTWDIVFRNQIIASAGQPNGWDVEEDHTAFGGFIVTVPTNATTDQSYEVRVIQPDWDTGRSSTFGVVQSNSIPSAPVLLPLRFSTNMVNSSGETVSLTVALDSPAPYGDAYVTLTGPSVANLPSWVRIPGGQRSITTNIQIGSTSPGTLQVTASYNGERVAQLTVVDGCVNPANPEIQSIGTNNLGVLLNWLPASGADAYNVSRSTDGSSYSVIFDGLTTTNFIDTSVTPGITYYYEVTALSNSCEATSGPINLLVPYPISVPPPWIIPDGGTFNNQVLVLITNVIPNTTIYYTVDGTTPNSSSSPNFGNNVNSGTIILTSNTLVQAFAVNSSYNQPSIIASANFIVLPPSSIDCGTNISSSLSAANSFSDVQGVGYFCSRYIFTNSAAELGQVVTLTASSSDFFTALYVLDNSSNVLYADYDSLYNGTNSQISFQITSPGTNIIEVTSCFPWETGDFTLEMDCEAVAGLNVFTNAWKTFNTNYAVFPIGGTLDFGFIPLGISVTNFVTLTNSGTTDLIISNIAVYPNAISNAGNGFTIAPSSMITLHGGGITNLAISMLATNNSAFDGYFIFNDNDGSLLAQNPFWANLVGEVGANPGTPLVTIYYPTNGLSIPVTNGIITNVVLELDAGVIDTNPITSFIFTNAFFTKAATIGSSGLYTVFWTNPPAGLQFIQAIARDSAGNSGTNSVTINVGVPSLTLTPTNPCVELQNGMTEFTATLFNITNGFVANSNVVFTITGPNGSTVTNQTGLNGEAALSYTGTQPGADHITASSSVAGVPVQAGPIIMNWAAPISCGNTYPGTLTNSSGFSMTDQYHYADYYSFTGTAGTPVRLQLNSPDFSTYMFIITNCVILTNVPVEALNTNDTLISYTPPANGTYIVEVTSSDIFKMGGYSLTLSCGAISEPQMAAFLSGTNFPNYGLLNFGSALTDVAVTNTLVITNEGNATLDITGWSLYEGLTNIFSVLNPPAAVVAPGTSTNISIVFMSTNSGQFQDALIFANNDPYQNPFVVNLGGVANPNNTPPTVNITSPSNGAQFQTGNPITILANAYGNNGATITNVTFIFRTTQGAYVIGSTTTPISGTIYSMSWTVEVAGNYSLQAVAYDNDGGISISPAVNITVNPSIVNIPPVTRPDYVTVLSDSMNDVLDVLTNDYSPSGDPLTITAIIPSTTPQPHGTAVIVDNGKHIAYTPPPDEGSSDPSLIEDGFSYQISDGKGGSVLCAVYVSIFATSPPGICITNPLDGSYVDGGTVIPLVAYVNPYQYVTNVTFYEGQTILGVVTNGPNSGNGYFTNYWIAVNKQCDCKFTAQAEDAFGQVDTSPEISINVTNATGANPPTASLISYTGYNDTNTSGSLTPDATTSSLFNSVGVTIQSGLFNIYGAATNSGESVTWTLALYSSDGSTLLRTLVPQATNSVSPGGFLATCDLTTIQNGTYQLRLDVVSDGYESESDVPITLDSSLKLGEFSFSQKDLVIPVKGIPLTITRTYNSIDPNSADFGYGWTFNINSMNVQLDETRETVSLEPLSSGSANIRSGGGRDVTLTLPDGRTAAFNASLVPGGEAFTEGLSWNCVWSAPGVTAKLTTLAASGGGGDLGDNTLLDVPGLPNYWQDGGENSTIDNYDMPGWILTTPDQTQYYITRGNGKTVTYQDPDNPGSYLNAKVYGTPTLTKIVEHSGDTIEIGDNGISHYDLAGNLTASIQFDRDTQGRIIDIHDPSNPNGFPAVKYEYDALGNLIHVERLADRNAGTYDTNTYNYTSSQFPHYITSMLSGDGTQVAQNYYDDSGKLIRSIDASGNVIYYNYNLTNNTQSVVDRLGSTNLYIYDSRGNVIAQKDPLGDSIANAYDANNNVIETIDSLGNTNAYAYDENNNKIMAVDGLNHTNLFTYNAASQLTTQTDPLGNVTTNTYDQNGDLIQTKQLDPNGNVITESSSTYNNNGLLQQIADANGRATASFRYDPSTDYMTQNTNANGFARTFSYDADGNVTAVSYVGTNASGAQVNVTNLTAYDAQNRVTVATDSYGNTNQTFYDLNGRISYTIDKFGNTSGFLYDARGNQIATTNITGTVTYAVYDADSLPILTTDPNGITGMLTEYDADGEITNVVRLENVQVGIIPDPNAPGQMTSIIVSLGTSLSTNSTTYYANGWVQSETTPDGTTTYTYWPNGQAETVTDPLNHTTTYAYDANGDQSLVWDANNHGTRLVYDAVGRMVSTIYDNNTSVSNVYNSVGQLVGTADQNGLLTQFAYNVAGSLTNVMKPQLPAGSPGWSYQYDPYGRLTVTTDPNSHSMTNFYDAYGNQIAQALPMGQTNASAVYNSLGQLWKEYDFIGQTIEHRYDNFGRETNKYYFAAGATTPTYTVSYTYDQLDQLTNLTQFYGSAAGNGYHPLAFNGSPLSVPMKVKLMASLNRYPSFFGGTTVLFMLGMAMAVIPADKRRRMVLAFAQAWRASFSQPYRFVAQSGRIRMPFTFWRLVAPITLLAVILSQPGYYELCTAQAQCYIPNNFSTTSIRITSFTYDFEGNLSQVNSPEGVINYSYDLATGRMTSLCTANSEQDYRYDALGRLQNVTVVRRNGTTLTSPETTTYAYDAVGNRSSVSLPNGVVTTYQYDDLNRLTNMTHTAQSGTVLANYAYMLDATGRRTNAVEVVQQESSAGYQTNTLTWQYDAMYRLTNEVNITASLAGAYAYANAYTYDPVGNRMQMVRTGGGADTKGYAYNNNDELTSVADSGVTSNYLYDANGSITNVSSGGSTICSYSYDLANKLNGVFDAGGSQQAAYYYNDDGIRTETIQGSTTTHFLIDSKNQTGYAQVLEELPGLGAAPTMSYVIGDEVLAQSTGSSTPTVNYFLQDGHGNNRQLTAMDGSVSYHYTYDAFGNVQTGSGSVHVSSTTANNAVQNGITSKLYCGEQYDAVLQMYNLRARYYDPADGRFNQRDATSGESDDPVTLHKYLYVGCDPINAIDPAGTDLMELMIVSAIIGGLSGALVGGIRGGVSGAISGLIAGIITGFLAPLALFGAGLGIAAATGGALSASAGMAIAFGLSMGIGTAIDTFNLIHAQTTRERTADGVALLIDIASFGFGAYKLSELPKLPPNARAGRILPTNKGQVGEMFSQMAALARGERLVARQVSIKPATGKGVRVDLVFKNIFSGKLRFVESKFGPDADLTVNQKPGYQTIAQKGGEIRTDKLSKFGLPKGTKIGPTKVQVDWWE